MSQKRWALPHGPTAVQRLRHNMTQGSPMPAQTWSSGPHVLTSHPLAEL